ncbi:MAG: phosphonate C-P lyase system protein PhnL [Negativicutes bacterium]
MLAEQEILSVSSLRKEFTLHMLGGKVIIGCDDVNFSLRQGEFMAVVGPSGAGKSSIVKCLYRTYLPTSGQIWYRKADGVAMNIAAATEREIVQLRQSDIAYVSQFLKVIPRISAIDTLAAGLRQRGLDMEAARRQAREYLSLLNIDKELWDAYPSTFSGGEQQRVNVARALIIRPRLLLLDEPTASLDAETKRVVLQSLMTLKNQGTTIIGIFHDTESIKRMADKFFTMSAGRCKSMQKTREVTGNEGADHHYQWPGGVA